MARRIIDERPALDRAEVAAHLGVAYTTVTNWHRHRDRFQFPAGLTFDGTQWFWLDDINAFYAAHLARKRAVLTEVDRRGNPTDLVGSTTAAKILGYGSHRNLPDGLLDRADRTDLLPSGRVRRRWYRQTVWALADARTGRQSTGRTPGTTGPRKPHPYAGDQRLQAAVELVHDAAATGQATRGLGAKLAARLDIPPRTAQRLIATACAARRQ